ncbi:MAG: hypothetical protein E6J90_06205 [Deltaproteobacteria bacterium]|nr:MAG: hypothetical protein E6J90_06205 [Deltaproteobacteria bacterium]
MSSLCDSLPAPTCQGVLPPLKPWDGGPPPPAQTDHGVVLIHPDPKNPGSMIAVAVDDGGVTWYVALPADELAKLLLAMLADQQPKTDASTSRVRKAKITPVGGPRLTRPASPELYRQWAAAELITSDVAEERSAQCSP